MHLDQSPTYRKAIIPWYDSDPACMILIAFTAVVFLFGLAGIAVAHNNPQFGGFIWVPALASALSLAAGSSALVRLIGRHSNRNSG